MKRTNKKGFTIAELVIVIAVIAILAAVLIPTFASIINKANESADVQAARQMNDSIVLTTSSAATPAFDMVVDALVEAGYNADDKLVPISKGYSFCWYSTYKTIILVNDKDEVIFPDNNEQISANFITDKAKTGDEKVVYNLAEGKKYIPAGNIVHADSLIDAIESGKESVTVASDLLISESIEIKTGEKLTLDLGGNTLATTTQPGDDSKHYYALNNKGTLEIKNAVIDSRGVGNYGTLILGEGVTINAADKNGGASIWNYSGEVIINGGTYTTTGDDPNDISAEPGIINNSGKITINGGTFTSTNSGCYAIISHENTELIINGGTFTGVRGINFLGSKLVINNATIESSGDNSAYALMIQSGSEIEISNSTLKGEFRDIAIVPGIEVTFNGVTFTASANDVVDGEGNIVLDYMDDGTNPNCHMYKIPAAEVTE